MRNARDLSDVAKIRMAGYERVAQEERAEAMVNPFTGGEEAPPAFDAGAAAAAPEAGASGGAGSYAAARAAAAAGGGGGGGAGGPPAAQAPPAPAVQAAPACRTAKNASKFPDAELTERAPRDPELVATTSAGRDRGTGDCTP